MHVVVVASDLAIHSQATAIATDAKATVRIVMSGDKLWETLSSQSTNVVLIDLQAVDVDTALVDRIRELAAPNCLVAAFAPHVHEMRLQSARDAGCDHVWSRGQWGQKLTALLASA